MSVRTHPMFTDAEGRLIDTMEDSSKDSPEACFSKDFTDNYENIAVHFREFARLKELCKLQYMGIFLKNYKKCVIENEQKLLADEFKINQIYEEQYRDLESKIVQILNEIKQKVSYHVNDAEVSAVNDALNNSFQLYDYNLVKNWLKNGGTYKNTLVGALAKKKEVTKSEIRDLIRKQFRARELEAKVEELKSTSRKVLNESYVPWPNTTQWVPSLFHNRNQKSAMNFIYGGVLLQPKLKETRLSGNSVNRYDISSTQLLENRLAPSRPAHTERFQPNTTPSNNRNQTTESNWSGDLYQTKRNMINYKLDIKNFVAENVGVNNPVTGQRELNTDLSNKFQSQFKLLSSHICEKSESFIRPITYKEARKEFESNKSRIIKEWEKHWGRPWPKTESGINFEAHHVIPLNAFPCNEWFNIIPLNKEQHRGAKETNSIHHGSHLNDLKEFLNIRRETYMSDYKK